MNDVVKKARWVSRITTWTLRLLLALTIVFFLGVFMAAMLSGNGPVQKASLEKVFGGFFGQTAKIQRLNTYEFFPVLRLDLDNLVVLPFGRDIPVAVLEHLKYEQDTLANMVGTAPVLSFDVKNFITSPGFWGPYSLHIKAAKIDPQSASGAGIFHVMGDYGGAALDVRVPMQGGPKYRVDPSAPILFTLGRVGGEVKLENTGDQHLRIKFSLIKKGEEKAVATGDVRLPLSQDQAPVQSDDLSKNDGQRPVLTLLDPQTGLTFTGVFESFSKQVHLTGTWGGEHVQAQDGRVASPDFVAAVRDLSSVLLDGTATDERGTPLPAPEIKMDTKIQISQLTMCAGSTALRDVRGAFALDRQTRLPIQTTLTAQGMEGPIHLLLRLDRQSVPILTQEGHHDSQDPAFAACSH